MTTEQELENVGRDACIGSWSQYKCWNDELLPALAKASDCVLLDDQLKRKAAQARENFLDRRVYPMLTPVTVDPSHPFPHVLNKALCIAFLRAPAEGIREAVFWSGHCAASVATTAARARAGNGGIHYVFLQEIISRYAEKLYRGYEILASAPFRITRNSNLVPRRGRNAQVFWKRWTHKCRNAAKGKRCAWKSKSARIRKSSPGWFDTFELDESLVFRAQGPVNLQRLFHLYEETPRPDLKYPPFSPRQVRIGHDADSMFEVMRRQDIFAAPSLRFLRHGREFSADCGARSARSVHEADTLPHELGFAGRTSAAGSGRQKGSDRGRGIKGELR